MTEHEEVIDGGYVPSTEYYSELGNRFSYHVPFGSQKDRYEAIRRKVYNLAEYLGKVCPPSRELSIAMTKLDEVMFFANASIARNEKELGEE